MKKLVKIEIKARKILKKSDAIEIVENGVEAVVGIFHLSTGTRLYLEENNVFIWSNVDEKFFDNQSTCKTTN